MNFWMFPMKPMKTTEVFFRNQNLSHWTMERKLDGHRAILIWKETGPELLSRERNKLPIPDYLIDEIQKLDLKVGTVLDGEVWSEEKRGGWKKAKEVKLSFWDVIALEWKWIGKEIIEHRRDLLEQIIPNNLNHIHKEQSVEVSESDYSFLKKEMNGCKTGGIHGVVFKKKGSYRYDHPNRSMENANWMKIVWRI